MATTSRHSSLRVRRSTFDALKNLNWDWMKRDIGEFVSDDEIRGMLARRDGIVSYFERLANERGWDKVVI